LVATIVPLGARDASVAVVGATAVAAMVGFTTWPALGWFGSGMENSILIPALLAVLAASITLLTDETSRGWAVGIAVGVAGVVRVEMAVLLLPTLIVVGVMLWHQRRAAAAPPPASVLFFWGGVNVWRFIIWLVLNSAAAQDKNSIDLLNTIPSLIVGAVTGVMCNRRDRAVRHRSPWWCSVSATACWNDERSVSASASCCWASWVCLRRQWVDRRVWQPSVGAASGRDPHRATVVVGAGASTPASVQTCRCSPQRIVACCQPWCVSHDSESTSSECRLRRMMRRGCGAWLVAAGGDVVRWGYMRRCAVSESSWRPNRPTCAAA
jgi:hypothetical protein